jgi:cell division septation protein DedD
MAQSDGEKELVLGSKQLLSLFFVVVALFGVFFALGYMIGHNSTKPVAGLDTPGAPAATTTAANGEVPRSADSEPPKETAAIEASPEPTPGPSAGGAPNDSGSSPAPHVAAPVTPPPSTVTPAQSASTHEATTVPQAGATYLQVTALHRADADNLVKTLREQSLPALVAASSKPDLFRVLVGPYHQVADVADAKAKLKSLGFANAFVQK